MSARDRDTVARELYSARRKLAANQRMAAVTHKIETAQLCDNLVASLHLKIARLEAEMRAAPQRPRDHHGAMAPPAGCTWARDASYRQTPFSEAEIESARNDPSLDIPEFLRRKPT
jgi:hypothetical protein